MELNLLGLARHGLNDFEQVAIVFVIVTAFVSLLYAWLLRGNVLKKDKGTPKMQEVWNAIRVGADSYLNRQLRTILPIIAVLTFVLFFSVYVVPPTIEAVDEFGAQNAQLIIAIGRTIAFVMGASFSLIVGQLGMRMAIQASVRAASASRRGFNEALTIAYYAGTITGMLTDGLGLFGGTAIFIVFGRAAPDALLGFGFGGTLLALFMRVGGGIYTKAADVGADLVGKVEKDIPEDDPRNAAVIADLVGDNVGDCAGMAADIFESYEVTIVSGLLLGLALYHIDHNLMWIVYPLIIRAIGVLSSILGTFTVPIWEKFPIKFLRAHDAEEAMFRSYEVSSVNTVLWALLLAIFYANDWRLAALTAIGVGLAVAFNPLTSYFTSTRRGPVKEIVRSTKTGAATTILSGLSVGMESSVWALVVIAISFVFAMLLYGGQRHPMTGVIEPTYVLYAVAMIGIGMLSHTGNNVAMDSYGPISDNANGIGEMAWHDQDDPETLKARQIMADLDAVGNTTKAITKGVAIASAVIAAVSLFASFITDVGNVQAAANEAAKAAGQALPYLESALIRNTGIRVSDTRVFIGLLLGGALPWLFSSLSIR
ncbi:MAG: sodium/proton-translocating pyrophosphatase, partial [Thermoflexales bacterium]|nr:sodium/proton-translocating pyrophosphatase [Thermoflexales bacterium]